jgi:hypothetical protein
MRSLWSRAHFEAPRSQDGLLPAACAPLKDHAGAGIFDVDQRRRLSAIVELIRIFGSDRPAHKDVAKYGTSCGYSRYYLMIRFNVVKEQHGWAIRMDERMMTPFWSRDLAIREANCLARAIRCHGECAEVIVEGAVPSEPLTQTTDTRSAAA